MSILLFTKDWTLNLDNQLHPRMFWLGYVQEDDSYVDCRYDPTPTGGLPPRAVDDSEIPTTVMSIIQLRSVQRERSVEKLLRKINKIEAGILKPITVDKDGYIINGHHRYDAYRILDYFHVNVRIMPYSIYDLPEKNS